MTEQAVLVNSKQLWLAALAAIVSATLALVMFILPAEYNIDPTGVGQQLGLTQLATNNNAEQILTNTSKEQIASHTHVIDLTVPAGKGVEYKFAMQQYGKLTYEWISYGAPLYFDLHGEPDGDTTGYFESYAVATGYEMKGSFTAPFTGSHGWYFKNSSEKATTVKLLVKGQFTIIGQK